jgi:probable F420-dependent oxidoreductase
MSSPARQLAERLGPVGVWLNVLAETPAAEAMSAAAQIEQLGYGGLWVGESPTDKEVFTNAGLLLSATSRITIATAVATIWGRDAIAANAAALTLGEAYPGRFVLGIGASHREVGRGTRHDKPLTAVREYLDALDSAVYQGPYPAPPVPRVLAALGPKMQELARDRSAGVHSFFVPPEHTGSARRRLGEAPILVPEQAVVVDSDPASARQIAREHVATRLALGNYVKQLHALGFSDTDLAGNGSDRLVDSLVAWGDAHAVAARIRAHLDAGADHVAVHPLVARGAGLPGVLAQLRELSGVVHDWGGSPC